jgi:N-acetylglutamate synthase-like GNAT family acetyltransferase
LLRCGDVAILGSAGVMPAYRRSGAITSLTVRAIVEARERGVETVILQTEAGAPLERLLRISGFKKVFARACYTLP